MKNKSMATVITLCNLSVIILPTQRLNQGFGYVVNRGLLTTAQERLFVYMPYIFFLF